MLCALLFLALSSLSFQWPVPQGRLTSTFGESRADHFHDGIDLVSTDNTVLTSTSGRLVYLWDKAMFPEENYPGGGNYKILSHGSMYSIYMHLEDGLSTVRDYEEKDPVGYIGNTGHSFAKHLHFSFLKRNERKSENPLRYLSQYDDSASPMITDFCFKIDDKYIIIREKSTIRLTKNYPILVKIVDSVTGRERLGIHTLQARFNGREVLQAEFSELRWSPNGLTASGRLFDSLFDEEGFYKIEGMVYQQGMNVLEIKAEDFSGNATERNFAFTVNLDMEKAD